MVFDQRAGVSVLVIVVQIDEAGHRGRENWRCDGGSRRLRGAGAWTRSREREPVISATW